MNFKIAMQKPRHLLHSQLGATFVEGAIGFGVVTIIVLIVIYSIQPRMSEYSMRAKVSEAVELASGFPLSLGKSPDPLGVPDPIEAGVSLTSFANLVAGNSVNTCAFLIQANGVKLGNNCTVSTSVYSLVPAVGSENSTLCASASPLALGLSKVQRFAQTECAARAFYGMTQPERVVLANSLTHFAVQKAASIKTVGLGIGE